ncbi:DUF2381 family protein [Corallococcus sicarius]|uniref:DUF2381 family protein n=1 Tax=Corallococcus sicarius TaxID=2316726 RepID=A0A3A8NLN7_9BACT|nr:DUF2381 family protein [Corallococcus sicarius]RKH45148.1 DUF2381 family protein [Corallococcus sicarius]
MPRLAAIVFLLLGAAVPAQPAPVPREPQERRVVLPDSATGAVPELRVAAGVVTLLLFDTPLDRGSVELEGRARFQFVDTGERMLALVPATDLRTGEQLGLRVRFADGASPDSAVFVLVSQPSVVDARVRVFRRAQSLAVLQAELAEARAQLEAQRVELARLRSSGEAGGPAGFALAGLLDSSGVRALDAVVDSSTQVASALGVQAALSFRAGLWGAVSITVRNDGREPWTPLEARLTGPGKGARTRVLGVHMSQSRVGPGEVGVVAVDVGAPTWKKGTVFSLELVDASGARRLVFPRVVL